MPDYMRAMLDEQVAKIPPAGRSKRPTGQVTQAQIDAAVSAAVEKEIARRAAITGHPEAVGRERLAELLANTTDLGVEEAAAVMAKAPPAAKPREPLVGEGAFARALRAGLESGHAFGCNSGGESPTVARIVETCKAAGLDIFEHEEPAGGSGTAARICASARAVGIADADPNDPKGNVDRILAALGIKGDG